MFRRIVSFLMILTVVLLCFSGCMSENSATRPSSSDTTSVVKINGKVELPDGFSKKLNKLKIVTCISEDPVNKDGSFTAHEPGSSLALAFVADAEGNPLLMGFLQSSAGDTKNEINALSTAVALLFQTLPAFTLPRETWPAVIALLENHPAAAKLAQTITEQISQKPDVLTQPNEELLAALETASDEIVAETGLFLPENEAMTDAVPIATFNVTVAAGSGGDVPALVSVEPSTEVSGIKIAPSDNKNGVVITNSFRRHLWAYAYRTGWNSADDDVSAKPRPVDPWQVVSSTGTYIRAVSGFKSLIGTLADFSFGQYAYLPVTSPPIILTVEPEEASKTYYTIVVVGPSWKDGTFESELPSEYASHTAESAVWAQAEQKMDALTWFQEFLFPAVLAVFPADVIGNALDSETMGLLIMDITKVITGDFPKFTEQISMHDYRGAFVTFLKAFESSALRKVLVTKMLKWGLIQGGTVTAATQFLGRLNVYFLVIDKLFKAGDLGMVVAHLTSAQRFAVWSAKAAKPNIRVQTDPSLVLTGEAVTMTCTGVAGIEGDKQYEWKTSGMHGHLEDSHGQSGWTFTSSDQQVRYVADKDAQDGDEDFIGVTAILKEGLEKKELGYGEADVIITDTARSISFIPIFPYVKPAKTLLLQVVVQPELSGKARYEILWACTGKFGTLVADDKQTGSLKNKTATYTAGESDGHDTITAELWQLLADGRRVRVCTSQVDIRVGAVRIVRVSKGTHWSNASELVLLVFEPVKGASKYSITVHFNQYDPTEKLLEAEKVIQDEYAKFLRRKYPGQDISGQLAAAANFYLVNIVDGQKFDVKPYKLDASAAPDNLISAGEVGVPLVIFDSRFFGDPDNAMTDFYTYYYDTVLELIEMVMHWDYELEVITAGES
jgi:hypothetical protein